MTEKAIPPQTTAYDNGSLFRLRQQTVPHKAQPYEFVDRRGAVTIMGVTNIKTKPHVLQCRIQRSVYGESVSLPGGNSDGSFHNPEAPLATALRELREEIGYGYTADSLDKSKISLFRLREVSTTIDYPRYLAILRDVVKRYDPEDNPHEIVEPVPIAAQAYLTGLYTLERGETYPELNAGFARAGITAGRAAVSKWLSQPVADDARAIEHTFEPWLIPEPFTLADTTDML
jgi:8-oxo-dGTP pyrophosphatase MutT (NUDIX family)